MCIFSTCSTSEWIWTLSSASLSILIFLLVPDWLFYYSQTGFLTLFPDRPIPISLPLQWLFSLLGLHFLLLKCPHIPGPAWCSLDHETSWLLSFILIPSIFRPFYSVTEFNTKLTTIICFNYFCLFSWALHFVSVMAQSSTFWNSLSAQYISISVKVYWTHLFARSIERMRDA